ncbi:MAG: hypothetical protein KAI47_17180, partial [Deltaproteobacteria bacterium]|nr:hypothetical protein [Deltaproteobacteria bacterium]
SGRAGAQGRRGPGRRKNTVSAFEAPVRVQAEKETNTLLILGTARDYLGLRKILRDLDRPRRQVYLQAHIIEANMSDTRDLGVVFHGGGTAGSSTLIGGLTQGAFNSLTLDATALASLSGLAFSLQGPAIPGSAKTFGTKNDISAFGLFIKALATQSSVDLLSSPHVLTLDNQPAEVIVGESIPLRSGITNAASSAAVGGDAAMLAALVQPVQYKEVGVKLKITPTIGEREDLRLKIEQEVSDVSKENFGGLGAAIAKRTIKTTVSLRDGQTVVIGGLVKQRTVVGKTKVPILGDIPILGRLFQSETKSQEKVNLLVVITPHVIRTPSDLRRVLEQKMRERQALLRSISRDGRPALALMTNLDFIYKRGLLSAINQAGAEAKREVALKKAGADTHEARPRELGPLRTGDTGGTARTARTADAPGPRRDRPPVSPSQP